VTVLIGIGVLSLVIWLGILLHPARPWDFQPVGDDEPLPPAPSTWPSVCILVPARNERDSLPDTLPALLTQEYPGEFAVVVIDDRSQDGTAEVARAIAKRCGAENRLTVIAGAPLPPGWVGKVWALEQGASYCGLSGIGSLALKTGKPKYLLLTDADIRHAPNSLRRLVAESEHGQLALNSRMARLRCVSGPERLLIPPFVFFFNLLYPMRQVNDPRNAKAGAAGGCVLLQTAALERVGGFSCIKDRIIDDVSLARQIKRENAPIRLTLSRTEVESRRAYDSIHTVWVMVRRTAFTELRYSWAQLFGTVVGMALMFVVPPLWALGGAGMFLIDRTQELWNGLPLSVGVLASGLGAWAIMARVYRPAVRFFRLPFLWCWTLPIAGVLYEGMTLDSAIRHVTGLRIGWRDQ
jgi:hopene-associated glycosyltransferase HpnB